MVSLLVLQEPSLHPRRCEVGVQVLRVHFWLCSTLCINHSALQITLSPSKMGWLGVSKVDLQKFWIRISRRTQIFWKSLCGKNWFGCFTSIGDSRCIHTNTTKDIEREKKKKKKRHTCMRFVEDQVPRQTLVAGSCQRTIPCWIPVLWYASWGCKLESGSLSSSIALTINTCSQIISCWRRNFLPIRNSLSDIRTFLNSISEIRVKHMNASTRSISLWILNKEVKMEQQKWAKC